MDEQTNTPTEAQSSTATGTPPAEAQNTNTPGPIPYDRFKAVNDAYADLKRQMAAIDAKEKERETAAKQAEEARLIEQQKFEQLANQRAAELEAVKPKIAQAEELLALIDEQNKARIAKLPEAFQPLVPTGYDVVQLSRWLEANAERLATPTPPALDGGRAGDRSAGPKKVELPRRNW